MKYSERRVSFSADPLETATALAARTAESHVLYENRGAIGWADGEYASVNARVDGATLTVDGRAREFPADGHPLTAVERALAAVEVEAWRAYGWATFELSHALHGLDDVAPSTPVAYLAVPRREIRFDGGTAVLRALDAVDLDALEEQLATAVLDGDSPARDDRVAVDIETHAAQEYRDAVATGVAEIKAGRLDKVILSRVVPVPTEIDLAATYLVGRRANNPARSYLLRLGGWDAAGFSPEIVIRTSADGDVITQPLAGTRAFLGTEGEDLERREELYRDAKEVFEHAISVRLAAAELSAVCSPGSVRVDEFMTVKERGSVQHLASELSGRLAEGRSPWDAMGALFPAVTASGIPKAPACELIRRTETEQRGLYSGAVLTVDQDGTIDAALVLRSVFRRDGRTWLRAGAGIVAQSLPERELEETCEKLRSVSRFLVPAREVPAEAVAAQSAGER